MDEPINKPIVLGVDTRDLRIAQTGARTYLTELIQQWQSMSNVNVVVLDTCLPVYRGRNSFLKIIEQLRFFWWKQIQLPLLAKRKGVTHLFCSDFFVPYCTMGLKTIPVLHDAFFWQSPAHYHPIWLRLFHWIGVPAAQKADLIIVPTEYAKKCILEHAHFDPKKMRVVGEAAKTFHQPMIGQNPINAPYFLHVGVLEKRKNLVRLVQAFAQFHAVHPHFKLVLVGNTPVKKHLNDSFAIYEAIDTLGLQDAVILLGYLEANALATIYTHAFAYILPSLNEGFGLPILEAFHFQLPLLCAHSSALPEVAGDAAIYFDPYQPSELTAAMLRLVDSPEQRDAFIAKGQIRLKDFSWAKSAHEIYELIAHC